MSKVPYRNPNDVGNDDPPRSTAMTGTPTQGQAAASGELVAKLRGRAKQDAIRFGSYGFYTPADVLLDNDAADTIDALERRVREAEEKLEDYKTNVIEDMRLDRDTAEAELAEMRSKLHEMREVLEWLNKNGGLGLDVHKRIIAVLASQQSKGESNEA
jgi:hypothetical protein